MLSNSIVNLPKVDARFAPDSAVEATLLTCKNLGMRRALRVGTPHGSRRYADTWQGLEPVAAADFHEALPHCPIDTVEACRETFIKYRCDGVIAIGGGSTIGLGKILSAEEAAVFVALPTTYSGSETTSIFGRKIDGQKRTAIDEKCRPDCIVYDARLSMDLPRLISITSAMNSIAHAVEALYPKVQNPLAATFALEALRAHKRGFDTLENGDELSARQDLLYGGFLGGLAIGMSGIALHHQLCHVIGGLFDLPHAETNSAILPHAIAYNRGFIPDADDEIKHVFGGSDSAQTIFDFASKHGAPMSLSDIGMPETGIERVVNGMLAHAGYNPRPLDEAALRDLVTHAYEGIRP